MTVSSIVYFVKMSKIQNLHFNSLREPQYPREKRKKEEIASNRIARNRKGDRTAHWLKYVPVDMGMKSENNICERIVLSPCVSCINIGRLEGKIDLGIATSADAGSTVSRNAVGRDSQRQEQGAKSAKRKKGSPKRQGKGLIVIIAKELRTRTAVPSISRAPSSLCS